jgi:hypothetical protein
MKKLAMACIALSTFAIAGGASAEEKGTVTIAVTTIYGRTPRPSAAVEVSRAKMTLPLKPLDGPSASSVTASATKSPF